MFFENTGVVGNKIAFNIPRCAVTDTAWPRAKAILIVSFERKYKSSRAFWIHNANV